MGLSLVSLSSGSRGNCVAVFSQTTCVLIDAGIGCRQIGSFLKNTGFSSASVLITHTHTDHVGRLGELTKALTPDVFCHPSSYYGVDKKMAGGRLSAADCDFFVGDLTISPFKVSHDVHCVGYSVYCGNKKVSVVTDTGCISDKVLESLKGSDIVFLESNHDENLLQNNTVYPPFLKQRILSAKGHLSNADSAAAAASLAASGTSQIVLGHLSEENNYPELAYNSVCRTLSQNGIKAGKDVHVDVATFNKITSVFKAG